MTISSRIHVLSVVGLAFLLALQTSPACAQLFGPGDPIIAIDLSIDSSYPAVEFPGNVADQAAVTKYLNFGGAGTGFIITPAFGISVVQSLRLTTANDFEDRDPSSYELYGTTDPISSVTNGFGDTENWTMISEGPLTLPSARVTEGPIVDFANGVAYTSYKMIFPTTKEALPNSMQVADVSLFTGSGGTGFQILAIGDPAIAVGSSLLPPQSNYPGWEGPANAIDRTLAKYLNFGKENSGFIVSRADGRRTVVTSFVITTARDADTRDPAAWALYGTNDSLTSQDNSYGDAEDWMLVDSGTLTLPSARGAVGPEVVVSNTMAYRSYRMVFPELEHTGLADSMHFAEIALNGICESDFDALTALYYSTDGDQWLDNTGWFSGPVETWHGVTVENCAVTRLELRQNNLTGSMPAELGLLTRLRVIDLLQNDLTGPVPPELGNLSELEQLELSGNQLSGSLPVTLGNLTNLTFLSCYENQLTGAIPTELGDLVNLDLLQLGANNFSGPLPSEIGLLSALRFLFVAYNPSLGGSLPSSLANLASLEQFHFVGTDLCEPTDAGFQAWLQGVGEVLSTGIECGVTAVETFSNERPTAVSLEQNHPNPTGHHTSIEFALRDPGRVSLRVFDVRGREVAELVSRELEAGYHRVQWNPRDLANGMYFYRLRAGGISLSRKFLVLN